MWLRFRGLGLLRRCYLPTFLQRLSRANLESGSGCMVLGSRSKVWSQEFVGTILIDLGFASVNQCRNL